MDSSEDNCSSKLEERDSLAKSEEGNRVDVAYSDSTKPEVKDKTHSEKVISQNTNSSDELLPSVGFIPDSESPNVSIGLCHTANEETKLENISGNDAKNEASGVNSGNSASAFAPYDVSHKIKKIKWQGNSMSIVTQNNNGPCPLISLINALVLKVCDYNYLYTIGITSIIFIRYTT